MGSTPTTLEEDFMNIIDNLILLLNSNLNFWMILLFGSLHWMYMQTDKQPQSCLDLKKKF